MGQRHGVCGSFERPCYRGEYISLASLNDERLPRTADRQPYRRPKIRKGYATGEIPKYELMPLEKIPRLMTGAYRLAT
jgi:hypothetical protein